MDFFLLLTHVSYPHSECHTISPPTQTSIYASMYNNFSYHPTLLIIHSILLPLQVFAICVQTCFPSLHFYFYIHYSYCQGKNMLYVFFSVPTQCLFLPKRQTFSIQLNFSLHFCLPTINHAYYALKHPVRKCCHVTST